MFFGNPFLFYRKLIYFSLASLFYIMLPSNAPAQEASMPNGTVFSSASTGLPKEGKWKCWPDLADVNGDGFLDLAATVRLEQGPRVWLGDGKGNWKDDSQGLTTKSISCGGGTEFADVNKDGKIDLVVADHCAGGFIYLGDGKGGWTVAASNLQTAMIEEAAKTKQKGSKAAKSKEQPSSPQYASIDPEEVDEFKGTEDVAVGDINEDGFPDLVFSHSSRGGFIVFLGDGTGKRWIEQKSTGLPNVYNISPGDPLNNGWASRVLLHDMNSDGHLDVVTAFHNGPRVFTGDGKGSFHSTSQGLPEPILSGLFWGITVGDVNEDGLQDIVVANRVDGPVLYLQKPDGTWQQGPTILPDMNGGAYGVTLADFDNDKHLDLLVNGVMTKGLGSIYGIFLCKGDGKGNFNELKNTNLPANGLSVTWGMVAGDVNKDGFLDFAIATGGTVPIPPPQFAAQYKDMNIEQEQPLTRVQVWFNQPPQGVQSQKSQ